MGVTHLNALPGSPPATAPPTRATRPPTAEAPSPLQGADHTVRRPGARRSAECRAHRIHTPCARRARICLSHTLPTSPPGGLTLMHRMRKSRSSRLRDFARIRAVQLAAFTLAGRPHPWARSTAAIRAGSHPAAPGPRCRTGPRRRGRTAAGALQQRDNAQSASRSTPERSASRRNEAGPPRSASSSSKPRHPSSRRHSATTTRPPPAWSPKPEEPGADMHPATTHADRSDVAV